MGAQVKFARSDRIYDGWLGCVRSLSIDDCEGRSGPRDRVPVGSTDSASDPNMHQAHAPRMRMEVGLELNHSRGPPRLKKQARLSTSGGGLMEVDLCLVTKRISLRDTNFFACTDMLLPSHGPLTVDSEPVACGFSAGILLINPMHGVPLLAWRTLVRLQTRVDKPFHGARLLLVCLPSQSSWRLCIGQTRFYARVNLWFLAAASLSRSPCPYSRLICSNSSTFLPLSNRASIRACKPNRIYFVVVLNAATLNDQPGPVQISEISFRARSGTEVNTPRAMTSRSTLANHNST